MNFLVTGGAGYIGSHVVKNLLKQGDKVFVFDNLSSGFAKPIRLLRKKYSNLFFINGDLANRKLLKKIFLDNHITAVCHLAAKIDVNESIKNPELYKKENFQNSVNLVEAMRKSGVNKLIFSSTAAVYGNPRYTPIDEKHSTNPLSPYGQTKLDFENYLKNLNDIKYIILRYFNVGGSDSEGLIGKSHINSYDLIENIMKAALGQKKALEIFGDDFETRDGTAIRDFVHVEDISQAHIFALKKIDKFSKEVFNLASEKGFSVQEIISEASRVVGKKIKTKVMPRRQGDIAVSLADATKAKKLLSWNPANSLLDNIIKTDWNWRKAHPLGYTR